jgi:hypothetical protein
MGYGRTFPLVTLVDENLWFSRVKYRYGIRGEIRGNGAVRVYPDRLTIGPTTVEVNGTTSMSVVSFNFFGGAHQGQYKIVTYPLVNHGVGIGIRGEANTLAGIGALNLSVSQRNEIDFEFYPRRAAFATLVAAVGYFVPPLGEKMMESRIFAQ